MSPLCHRLPLSEIAAYIVGKQYVRFGKILQYAVDKDKMNEINLSDESSIDTKSIFTLKYGKLSNVKFKDNSNARHDFNSHADAIGGGQFDFQQQTPNAGRRKWFNGDRYITCDDRNSLTYRLDLIRCTCNK